MLHRMWGDCDISQPVETLTRTYNSLRQSLGLFSSLCHTRGEKSLLPLTDRKEDSMCTIPTGMGKELEVYNASYPRSTPNSLAATGVNLKMSVKVFFSADYLRLGPP